MAWEGLNSRIAWMLSHFTGYDDYGNPLFDRALTDAESANINSAKLTDGIFYNDSSFFQVLPHAGMTLRVRRGFFQMRGREGYTVEDDFVDLNPGGPTTRHDLVVLRLDLTDPVRGVMVDVKTGTRELTRTTDIMEFGLADIEVRANTSTITAANIRDLRLDPNFCGLVDYIYKLDTADFFRQIDGYISDFSEYITDQITLWEAIRNEQQRIWQENLDALHQQYLDRDAVWNAWFSNNMVEIAKTAQFDFDNLAALPGVEITTTFHPGGQIEEIMTVTGTGGRILATRNITFPAGNIASVREVVFMEDGVTRIRDTEVITDNNLVTRTVNRI